jgi:hypothetical protein
MAEVNGKSPLQLWQDKVDEISEEQGKYDNMPNKTLKSAHTKFLKIAKLKKDIVELELRKDDDVLSEGCKTYLAGVYGWEKYKKWPMTTGEPIKQFRKGVLVEQDAIVMLSGLDGRMYWKNKTGIKNEFLRGIPDIIEHDKVIDIKSPWDIESFLENLTKELTDAYWWQVQGYLDITKLEIGEISYCLMSHPSDLVDAEVDRLRQVGFDSTVDKLRSSLTFDEIAPNERRIKFVVERDQEAIDKIHKRVLKCREFLSEIEQKHMEMSKNWTKYEINV